jgi:predicted transcriptional regulator of viral defense system
MVPNHAGYSQSRGIKLLETALREFGPIFTLDQLKQAARAQQLSDSHLRFLISSLASAGWIEIIKRGTYVVKSPLYSGEIPPFAIAAALMQPMAISHWSACAQHGFTTQIPIMVQASTPRNVITPEMHTGKAHSPRGRAAWQAFSWDFEFIHVKSEHFWGFQEIWVNSWQKVNITDPERTVLDLFIRPEIFGGVSAIIEILENVLAQIKVDRLVDYALKYDTGSIIKRLGWTLESLGVAEEALVRLQNYSVARYYPLDSQLNPGDRKNMRWKIVENLGRL